MIFQINHLKWRRYLFIADYSFPLRFCSIDLFYFFLNFILSFFLSKSFFFWFESKMYLKKEVERGKRGGKKSIDHFHSNNRSPLAIKKNFLIKGFVVLWEKGETFVWQSFLRGGHFGNFLPINLPLSLSPSFPSLAPFFLFSSPTSYF